MDADKIIKRGTVAGNCTAVGIAWVLCGGRHFLITIVSSIEDGDFCLKRREAGEIASGMWCHLGIFVAKCEAFVWVFTKAYKCMYVLAAIP